MRRTKASVSSCRSSFGSWPDRAITSRFHPLATRTSTDPCSNLQPDGTCLPRGLSLGPCLAVAGIATCRQEVRDRLQGNPALGDAAGYPVVWFVSFGCGARDWQRGSPSAGFLPGEIDLRFSRGGLTPGGAPLNSGLRGIGVSGAKSGAVAARHQTRGAKSLVRGSRTGPKRARGDSFRRPVRCARRGQHPFRRGRRPSYPR